MPQDAERRDFTVNALFYNVTSNVIEDLTGHGLVDLRSGVLRTPLEPRVTFLDDPLRVLRALRFASRFGFAMVPPLRAAAVDSDVLAALASKVSRERVGNETELMLAGPRPLSAARVLHAFGLLETLALTGPAHVEAARAVDVGVAAMMAGSSSSGPSSGSGAAAASGGAGGGKGGKGGKGFKDADTGAAAADGAEASPGPHYAGHWWLPPLPAASFASAASAADTQAALARSLHLPAVEAAALMHCSAAAAAAASPVSSDSSPSASAPPVLLSLAATCSDSWANGAANAPPHHAWSASMPDAWVAVSARLVAALHAVLAMSPQLAELLSQVPDTAAAASAPAGVAAATDAPAAGGAGAGSASDAGPSAVASTSTSAGTGAGAASMSLDAPASAGSRAWPFITPATESPESGAALAGIETLPDALQALPVPGSVRRTLAFATLFMPLLPVQQLGRKGRAEPLVFKIVAERLKRKHKDAEDVLALQEGTRLLGRLAMASLPPHAALSPLSPSSAPSGAAAGAMDADTADRLQVGLTLRNVARAWWPASLVLSAASCIAPLLDEAPSDARVPGVRPDAVAAAEAVFAAHLALASRIRHEWRLDNCWTARPLLDGKAVMAALAIKGGPAMKPAIDELTRWQLLHPDATAEEATVHLKAWKASNE